MPEGIAPDERNILELLILRSYSGAHSESTEFLLNALV